jgi:hypothetical protein
VSTAVVLYVLFTFRLLLLLSVLLVLLWVSFNAFSPYDMLIYAPAAVACTALGVHCSFLPPVIRKFYAAAAVAVAFYCFGCVLQLCPLTMCLSYAAATVASTFCTA